MTFGHVTPEKVPSIIREFLAHQETGRPAPSSTELLQKPINGAAVVHVGLGSCCMAKGSDDLYRSLQQNAGRFGGGIVVKRVGCVGMCHRTPMIEASMPD
jgi:NADH-quinone oxidoreductase subunit F